jgi:hypothetical protein
VLTKILYRQYQLESKAEGMILVGNVCLGQIQPSHAEHFYKVALEHNPDHAGALFNLGVLSYMNKKYDAAYTFWLKVHLESLKIRMTKTPL